MSQIIIDMPKDVYEAYKKDFQNGTVTVGNVCGAKCFFCSQKWNPPGIIKNLKRFLTIKEIKHFTKLYLNTPGQIATGIHVNSGEFFLHPNASEILNILSTKMKSSIKLPPIFTNGMDLKVEHIKIIKKFNYHLFLSLNSSNIITRKEIMDNTYFNNKNAINSMYLLDKYSVSYSVFIVPLRSTIDNGDVENTIKYINQFKAKSIILHRPGYTQYTPSYISKELSIPDEELFNFSLLMRQKYKVNMITDNFSGIHKIRFIFEVLHRLFKKKKYLNDMSKLFLCAGTAEEGLSFVSKTMKIRNYKIKTVKSKVFGGNVNCAGLLLVEDYIYAIKEFLEQKRNKKPEVIILPNKSFDINLEDLSMTSVQKIKDHYHLELIVV